MAGVLAFPMAGPFGSPPTPGRRMSFSASTPPADDRESADSGLVRRMAAGDKAACGELYDRFSRPLYSLALRVTGDSAEAQDVVQEVFVALWNKAAAFDPARGSAFAWAISLTRNRAIDRLRMRRRRAALIEESFPADLAATAPATDSADDLIFKEKAGAVRAALATLPRDQLRALELAYFGNLTQQEIAARLAEPLGTVKARIRRGLLKLRDTLAHRHD
jgi:RNA polymerase sigma-70 factor (ECF subfamily)